MAGQAASQPASQPASSQSANQPASQPASQQPASQHWLLAKLGGLLDGTEAFALEKNGGDRQLGNGAFQWVQVLGARPARTNVPLLTLCAVQASSNMHSRWANAAVWTVAAILVVALSQYPTQRVSSPLLSAIFFAACAAVPLP
jgi:hypothetical protein